MPCLREAWRTITWRERGTDQGPAAQAGRGAAGASGHRQPPPEHQAQPVRTGPGRVADRRAAAAGRDGRQEMVLCHAAGRHLLAAPDRAGPQPLAHRAVLRRQQRRVRPGRLSRPTLGWPASACGPGHARLQLSRPPPRCHHRLRPGGGFPPLSTRVPASPPCIGPSSSGSSRTSSSGSSPQSKPRPSVLVETNEVVLVRPVAGVLVVVVVPTAHRCVVVAGHRVLGHTHHAQHGRAAGAQEADDQAAATTRKMTFSTLV